MKLETRYVEQIAQASSQQLKQRIEAYTGTTLMFQYFPPEKMTHFFLQLDFPEKPDFGLVTDENRLTRERFSKLAEQAFKYEAPSKTLFTVYPRGIIFGEQLAQDKVELADNTSPKNLARRIKAEAIRFNRRLSPAVRLLSHGIHGTHAFSSEKEYRKSLRNPAIYRIMSDIFQRYVENQDEGARYFGVFRLDMLAPRINKPGEKKSGWLEKWEREVKIPLVILPNATPKELEELIEIEKIALGV